MCWVLCLEPVPHIPVFQSPWPLRLSSAAFMEPPVGLGLAGHVSSNFYRLVSSMGRVLDIRNEV